MYRVGSTLLAAALFVAFVPGVLMTFPPNCKKWTVLVVHGLLFAVVTNFVMHWYHSMYKETFGNFGTSCPAGWHMDNPDPTQIQTCKPSAHSGGMS